MERGNYVLRKVVFAVVTLIVVAVFNFFLFRILPGDPVRLIIHSPRMTREAQDRIRTTFGLDKPVWIDTERLEDGDILEVGPQAAKITEKISAGNVYVDGLSVGDIGSVVLRNRRMLSRDGIVVVIIAVNKQTGKLVGRPDIVSRGFVDTRVSNEMIEKSRDAVARILDRGGEHPADWGFISTKVRDTLNRFYYEQTRRRPMILPFMVKV